MTKLKCDPSTCQALKIAGLSNRSIARHLKVNEASVRRALKRVGRRVTVYVIEEP